MGAELRTKTVVQTGHVGLNVTNIERSKEFYQNIFHFDISAESSEANHRYIFLNEGATLILTLWEQSTGQFLPRTPGLHHLSFEVESVDAVKRIQESLKAMNVNFAYEGIVPHREGSSSGGIFFFDPDGIRLEVYAPSGVEAGNAPVKDQPTCGFF